MKKVLAVMLALLLIIVPCAAAGEASVCFIALNENLLPLTSQAVSQGGQYYVPLGIFRTFGIYDSWSPDTQVAVLQSSSHQISFNLSTGESYDEDNNYYTSSAISRGGSVYVPVNFVCRQFGLSWSYIRGSTYGDVCRIRDGSARFTDEQFMVAARPMMISRYDEYINSGVGSKDDPAYTGQRVVFLSFQGLPSDTLLSTLQAYGLKAAFFLESAEITDSPETVRRIIGEGHNVGVLCEESPGTMYESAVEALWSRAHFTTVLIASASSEYDAVCRSYAESSSLVYCAVTIDGVNGGAGCTASQLSSAIDAGLGPISYLRILCCPTTDSNINAICSLLTQNTTVLAACETS